MKKHLFSLIVASLGLAGPGWAQSTLYWYPNSQPNQGGGGTWDGTPTKWSTTPGATKTPASTIPGAGDSVVFGGGAGTVTYGSGSGYPQLNDWKVETAGYIFRSTTSSVIYSVNTFSGAELNSAIFEANGVHTSTFEIRSDTAFGGTIRNGGGTLTFTKTGSGRWDLSAATLTYTGLTIINDGSLWLSSSHLIGANALAGAIRFGSAENLGGNLVVVGGGMVTGPLGSSFVIGAAGNANLNLKGGFGTRNADLTLNFGGASAEISWGSANFRATTFTLGTSDSTHTVHLTNNLSLTQDGRVLRVENGTAAIDAELSGALSTLTQGRALTKDGGGTLRYSGTTASSIRLNHTAGTILIDGDWASSANNTSYGIQVAAEATLGGGGLISLSAASLDVSGVLMAGRGEANQSLTVNGSLNMLSDSVLAFGLGSTAEERDFLIRTGGVWTFQSDQKIQLFDVGATDTTYTLISGLSGLVDVSNWQVVNSGGISGIFTSDANNIYVTLSTIPEPSTLALVVGVAGIGLLRRRRSNRLGI